MLKLKQKITILLTLLLTTTAMVACSAKAETLTTKNESTTSKENSTNKNTENPAPVVNQKDKKGNPVEDNVTVPKNLVASTKVEQFFTDCVNMSFNIKDVNKAEAIKRVRDYQKENFAADYIPIIESFYSDSKGISLTNFQIESTKETTITTKDGKKLPDYAITYKATLKLSNGKTVTIEEEWKPAEALISYVDSKCQLRQFNTK